jgi:multiple antibiotic resistance protein
MLRAVMPYTIEVSAFVHAFIPLLIAVDVVGIVPIYLALTATLAVEERRAVLRSSLIVATAVSIGFALVGKAVFIYLGITVADFQVAGGLILLGLAGLDLLAHEPRGLAAGVDVGVVPLGVPIIAGPAVITTSMLLVDQFGTAVTLLALIANLVIAGVVLANARNVERLVGRTGARAMSKIVSLLLAAIGVHWIRQGLR